MAIFSSIGEEVFDVLCSQCSQSFHASSWLVNDGIPTNRLLQKLPYLTGQDLIHPLVFEKQITHGFWDTAQMGAQADDNSKGRTFNQFGITQTTQSTQINQITQMNHLIRLY